MTRPLQTRALKHGHWSGGRPTPTYLSWQALIQRCTNPKTKEWSNYGGRGITVCQRWRDSFEAFLADVGERPEGTSIDRFPNNDGNYEPGNVRWATRAQQHDNQRRNRRQLSPAVEQEICSRIERGEGQKAIAADLGINKNTVGEVWKRLRPSTPNPNRGRALRSRS